MIAMSLPDALWTPTPAEGFEGDPEELEEHHDRRRPHESQELPSDHSAFDLASYPANETVAHLQRQVLEFGDRCSEIVSVRKRLVVWRRCVGSHRASLSSVALRAP